MRFFLSQIATFLFLYIFVTRLLVLSIFWFTGSLSLLFKYIFTFSVFLCLFPSKGKYNFERFFHWRVRFIGQLLRHLFHIFSWEGKSCRSWLRMAFYFQISGWKRWPFCTTLASWTPAQDGRTKEREKEKERTKLKSCMTRQPHDRALLPRAKVPTHVHFETKAHEVSPKDLITTDLFKWTHLSREEQFRLDI